MEAAAEETHKDAVENSKPENPAPEEKRTPPVPEPTKKSKREDKKKDDKFVDQFMKAINAVPTVDEKVKIANEKYAHMVEDNKKLQFFMKQSEKRHALMLKEKEQLQHEYNKTVLVKSKLENLCRELQKQNKAIKDESLHKIREEEERRKETQNKFQNTLSEITALLQQNNDKNAKLRDDNIAMTEKFKSVVAQYQLREQQVDKMSKQMSLEQQLSEAKMQKASLEHQAERERMTAEMEQLKMTIAQYRAKIQELHGTESGLRTQLSVYTDKYDEFQGALVKSNQLFTGFKDEMEKMSKKIKKLEKESLSWKKRWETSQGALLEMCGERQAREAAGRQLASMQSLCRTLQAERTLLLNTLKENNIERPPLPAPAPAPAPASDAKVDAMAANCAQLRQSLAHLQSQLNVLTSNKQTDEPPKQDKPKKSKSKKSKKQEVTKADSVEVKEESDSNTNKEVDTAEIEPSVEGVNEQIDIADEKVDDKTLESLIEAISNANIDISDLEVDNNINVEEVLNNTSDIDNVKAEVTEIETVEPKITEIEDLKTTDLKLTESKVTEQVSVENLPKGEPQKVEIESTKPDVLQNVLENSEPQVNGL